MKIKLILQGEGQEYSFEVESNTEELNLACLSLDKINLESLEDCKDIKKIDLSSNNLSSINLLPLVNCKKLRSLDLSNNQLLSINLSP
ncbi:MAG: hypothetical protein KAS52_06365, partial [Candidatus Heimdallarchaeota archaeon]|nr:hypothetical protein [Candidatus Heimdallarchaeota archaeon]